jgi:hypothetical protein
MHLYLTSPLKVKDIRRVRTAAQTFEQRLHFYGFVTQVNRGLGLDSVTVATLPSSLSKRPAKYNALFYVVI